MIPFTPSEKKAILLTIIILTGASLTHIFYPDIYEPVAYNYTKSDSIFIRRSSQPPNRFQEKEVRFNKKDSRFINGTIRNKEGNKINLKLDINGASLSELQKLPGIGPVLAQRIIVYRLEHGEFKSIEELKKVKGIGSTTIKRIRSLIKIK
jgi:comEA protein